MVISGETIMTGGNGGKFGTRGVSELRVMFSGGGYYLGTETTEGSPYSRETCYFGSESEAETALADWKQGKHTGMR